MERRAEKPSCTAQSNRRRPPQLGQASIPCVLAGGAPAGTWGTRCSSVGVLEEAEEAGPRATRASAGAHARGAEDTAEMGRVAWPGRSIPGDPIASPRPCRGRNAKCDCPDPSAPPPSSSVEADGAAGRSVVAVAAILAGAWVGEVERTPYRLEVLVPADALPGETLSLVAQARDEQGSVGTSAPVSLLVRAE